MSRTYVVDADGFGAAMDKILTDVRGNVLEGASEAVKKGLKVASRAWKSKAASVLSSSYKKGGHLYYTGEYARSINYKMSKETGETPSGEAGSKKLPGLPHLLELGHATLGGGRVPGRPHIAPAAEIAFRETERLMDIEIWRRLNA